MSPTTATAAGVGSNQHAPPSVVADVPYPNVPDTVADQQAATAPGTGSAVEGQPQPEKIPFKDQVNGYAKKIAGTVFRNEDEKKFGQAKLEGNA